MVTRPTDSANFQTVRYLLAHEGNSKFPLNGAENKNLLSNECVCNLENQSLVFFVINCKYKLLLNSITILLKSAKLFLAIVMYSSVE